MSPLLFAIVLLAAVVAVRLLSAAVVRSRSAQLVDSSIETYESGVRAAATDGSEDPWLVRWLSRAGYRTPSAPLVYQGATAGLTAVGLALVLIMNRLHVFKTMVESLAGIPGGLGELLAAVANAGPYIILAILAAAPTLVVRAARRDRVETIEQDLAPTLELLATLAEAGFSFDAAIARIQESESGERPLTQEFHIYQRDTLGGIARLESLRQLARRIDITSVSIFVSALIQAEQVGASLSETLRTQADDLRDRRKLRALLLAQALPVKLVFPLIFCFLPGIFFSTLGPVLSQFVDVMDSVLRTR